MMDDHHPTGTKTAFAETPVTSPVILITWPRFRADDPETGGRLVSAGYQVRHAPNHGGRDPGTLIELLEGAVGAIVSADPFTAEVFAASPMLRVVARTGVGLDSIDVSAAEAAGVTLFTTPGANHNSVADHTMALILALVRRLVENDTVLRKGHWDRAGDLSGGELTGARVGLIGFGRIGRAVARRLEGFEVEIRVCDPGVTDASPYRLITLEELMKWSEIISIHCPLTPATADLIDSRQLDLARPGLILINTARGGIVNEAALADAIRSGRVAGAGLDVFGVEPPHDSDLLNLPGVIVSPHIAGLSNKSMGLMLDQCIYNVLEFLDTPQPARQEHRLPRLSIPNLS